MSFERDLRFNGATVLASTEISTQRACASSAPIHRCSGQLASTTLLASNEELNKDCVYQRYIDAAGYKSILYSSSVLDKRNVGGSGSGFTVPYRSSWWRRGGVGDLPRLDISAGGEQGSWYRLRELQCPGAILLYNKESGEYRFAFRQSKRRL